MKNILIMLKCFLVLTSANLALADFVPTSIASLKLWLDASDNTTVLTSIGPDVLAVNGNPVYRWKDKSGNSYHADQATAGNQPSFNISAQNSKGGIVFDGATADFLSIGAVLGKPASYTVVTVAMNTSNITASTSMVALGSADSSANKAWGLIAHNFCCGSGAGSLEYFGPSTDLATNYGRSTALYTMPKNSTYFLLTQKYTTGATAPIVYLNSSTVPLTNTAVTVTAQSGTAQNFSIGRPGDVTSSYWRGTILEVMIFNAALSDVERVNVEKYLSNKWALYQPAVTQFSTKTVETTATGNALKIPFSLYSKGYPVDSIPVANINCSIKVPDAAIAACTGTIAEAGTGQYTYTLAAGDIDAVGNGSIRLFSAFTDDSVVDYQVVLDPFNKAVEGVYTGNTIGGYLDKVKKYVANRMTKSGTAYTIYKDDKTTVYESGTTTGAERAVP